MMVTVTNDTKVYDNGEDTQVWAIAGTYNDPKDIILESRDMDNPGSSHRFKPDYAGDSAVYILLAWDESYGVLHK